MKPEMDPLMVKISPDPHKSSQSADTFTKPKSKPTISTLQLLVASLIFLAVTLGLLSVSYPSLLSKLNLRTDEPDYHYSVVIDAGSSGTRAHVFRYTLDSSGNPVFNFDTENYHKTKVDTGLSKLVGHLENVTEIINKLVEFAKTIVVSDEMRKTIEIRQMSEIYLMATAGMRSLKKQERIQILDVAKRALRASGFKFKDKWARVIPGEDEGIYAWVIANYALGSLDGKKKTTGIVELGGASAQVTFESSEAIHTEVLRPVILGGVAYYVYTHSFQHLGQNEAHDKLWELLHKRAERTKKTVTDPCTPNGFDEYPHKDDSIIAAGDFDKCKKKTDAMWLREGNENCPYKHCSIGSTFEPDLEGNFLALSSFDYTAKYFKLNQMGWLSELIPEGKIFCKKNWLTILEKKEEWQEKEHLLGYCFSSAYIISMLHERLGFALEGERIKFASKAGDKNIPLDWALGVFIFKTVNSHYKGAISRKMLG